ncbi:4-coumarate--CoA ligase-like 3 [Brachypodium distachyon]|uniref:4-coumarate--CoA ligase-like 3 n=1 Tax=Brachypodium distachyon TaxID=15368 RepID=UPI0006E4A165|nr:4-coumarate--CoA ligase-like 3 [Brachypodium distachyon]|eukprot:XP_014756076.1 4-coumarate--CoA ligase-like 3 [Brachypodium distachyon]
MEAETTTTTTPFGFESGDAAAFVLSRTADAAEAGDRAAFVDAATGREITFAGLRRAALSLAAGLRLGLGLRRGDAVLLVLDEAGGDQLLVPPIILGVLAAGGVVVVAAADAAVAHGSGAAMVVAAPEAGKKVAAAVGAPLLLISQSPDPRTLSAEELMDGGDPTALVHDAAAAPWDVAIVVHSSASKTKKAVLTHADLIAAMAGSSPGEGRVCLACLPTWGAGTGVPGVLPLLALGLPAAGVTTVLVPPVSDLREAVAVHGATDVVATPEAAAALVAPMASQGKLATLRRVTLVAQAPLAEEASKAFRRRLAWVEVTEMFDAPEMGTEVKSEEQQQVVAPAELGPLLLVQPEAPATAAAIQQNSKKTDQMAATNEATSLVPPLKKIQKSVFGDILTKSITAKILRRHPVACDKQAVSKL